MKHGEKILAMAAKEAADLLRGPNEPTVGLISRQAIHY